MISSFFKEKENIDKFDQHKTSVLERECGRWHSAWIRVCTSFSEQKMFSSDSSVRIKPAPPSQKRR